MLTQEEYASEAFDGVVADVKEYIEKAREQKKHIQEIIQLLKTVLPWVIGFFLLSWLLRD